MCRSTWIAGVVCALLLLVAGASPVPAESVPTGLADDAPGSLTVSVVDAKDQPAINTPVVVSAVGSVIRGGTGGGGGRAPSPAPKSVIGDTQPQPLQKGGPIVGKSKTNEKGVAEFKGLKPGDYYIVAGNPTVTGFKRERVTIHAGKETSATVKLNPPNPPSPGGSGDDEN